MLALRNSPWKQKMPQTSVGGSLQYLQNTANISEKAREVFSRHLVSGKKGLGVSQTGYEAAYIRSYDEDTLAPSSTLPGLIQAADAQKTSIQKKTTLPQSVIDAQQISSDAACGVASDATVPLLKRPKALKCRIKTFTLKDAVKISYKNAQGPVLRIDALKESGKEYLDGIK
jgi:hypothetical protein